MNRYPLWKYILVLVVLVVSALYAIPNIFPETPAIQISAAKQPAEVTKDLQNQIIDQLKQNNIEVSGAFIQDESLKIRFQDQETQAKARAIIEDSLDNGYVVALNFIPSTPDWMAKIGAKPMYLGLDLRGGIHFLMQVDMEAAYRKKLDSYSTDIRRLLRDNKIRNGGVKVSGDTMNIAFQDQEKLTEAINLIKKNIPNLTNIVSNNENNSVVIKVNEKDLLDMQASVIQQNMSTLNNRVNALGVAEPIIQQSGQDRIMLQLPGVQDTAQAKNIIGRTATLEVRMVADDKLQQQAINGNVPIGYELIDYPQSNGATYPLLVSKQVELTGDNINSATPGTTEMGQASVNLKLDSKGSSIFYDLTKNNRNKRIAMALIEQDSKEVVTAPVVNEPIPAGNVQISGSMSPKEAADIALLLQSGSLAAPMKIIEERSIGPSAGQENIDKGFHSVLWGFLVIIVFMIFYYRMFGIFSSLSLVANLVMLVAILSIIQATLTLPGIAAIALTLGMAIDANVLINERVREELRMGDLPQTAISKGYEFAWGTILDSNITSLIAGLALLIFSGAGPVKGFAVVHCLGILTSMFSSVVVSRALANLWYGRKKNLTHISIGTIYKPDGEKV
ncbi:protein translocase subunit SecD [Neisseriaceae bacterium PsAf]|nr:protein translocase subunit SecD [Neisseriaceae bacterium PsAf]